MSLPSGTYYFGDLCYVMHDCWDEVCGLVIKEHTCLEGEFQLKDGRRFAMYSTAYGDGTYCSNGFGSFSVDSGSLGCILADDIKDLEVNKETLLGLGNIVEMENEFVTGNHDGTIHFGRIAIYTDEYEEEEEEEYEEEY